MDWIGFFFLIFQMYLLSYKPKSNWFNTEKLSFMFGMIGCFFLVIFGFIVQSIPTISVNCIMLFLNFRGYTK